VHVDLPATLSCPFFAASWQGMGFTLSLDDLGSAVARMPGSRLGAAALTEHSKEPEAPGFPHALLIGAKGRDSLRTGRQNELQSLFTRYAEGIKMTPACDQADPSALPLGSSELFQSMHHCTSLCMP